MRAPHAWPVGAHTAALLFIALCVSPAVVTGQTPRRLPGIGSRVRVTTAGDDGAQITGRLLVPLADSLVVRSERDTATVLTIADGEVSRLEVYTGEHAATAAGTVGGVLGAVGGAAYYLKWCNRNPGPCERDLSRYGCNCSDTASSSLAEIMVFGGALVGGLVGYALLAPHWERLDLPVRVGVVPLGTRRIMIGASVALDGQAWRRTLRRIRRLA